MLKEEGERERIKVTTKGGKEGERERKKEVAVTVYCELPKKVEEIHNRKSSSSPS